MSPTFILAWRSHSDRSIRDSEGYVKSFRNLDDVPVMQLAYFTEKMYLVTSPACEYVMTCPTQTLGAL